MSLDLAADRRLVRARHRSVRHVVVRVTAPGVTAGRERPPVAIAFVVDRSGSMAGDKIARAREAVARGLDRLQPTDRFAVVAYDDAVEVVAPSARATPAAVRQARAALARLAPGNTTDLAEGHRVGGGQVLEGLRREEVGRVLLLTDGLANAGVTAPDELARRAADLRAAGVSTSTFGVGADFDEGLLGRMADAGGGTFRFLDTSERIVSAIAQELGEALDVVARDVAIEIAAPAGVDVAVVGPWRVTRADDPFRVALPDLVAGQEMDVVVRLRFPLGEVGRPVDVRARVVDRDAALGGAEAGVRFTHADGAAVDAEPRDVAVDRVVAAIYANQAREEAALLARDGRGRQAAERLRAVARKVGAYAGLDAELRALVASLEDDARASERPADPMEIKLRHFASTSALRSKLPDGSSRRR